MNTEIAQLKTDIIQEDGEKHGEELHNLYSLSYRV